jgi:3-phenylpropionate/trans-cinnamate dioxygenase ferredoxin subunit
VTRRHGVTNSSREARVMAMKNEAVAHVRDITPGTTQRVEIAGEGVLLCNVGGTFYAIEDLCTHDGGELDQGELEGCRIMCPRHGAYFDVSTGAALTLPAVLPVRTFLVRVEGDDIFVEA